MSVDTLALAIHTTAKLVLLWVVIFFGWRSYRVDALRQRLFAIRDELFDLAGSGAVPFTHPGYWRLRVTINSLIRFAHRTSFSRLLFIIAFAGPAPEPRSYAQWKEAVESVESEDVRIKLRALHNRAMITIMRHMITGSPVLLLLLAVLGIVVILQGAARHCIDAVAQMLVLRMSGRLAQLEDEAVESRNQEIASMKKAVA